MGDLSELIVSLALPFLAFILQYLHPIILRPDTFENDVKLKVWTLRDHTWRLWREAINCQIGIESITEEPVSQSRPRERFDEALLRIEEHDKTMKDLKSKVRYYKTWFYAVLVLLVLPFFVNLILVFLDRVVKVGDDFPYTSVALTILFACLGVLIPVIIHLARIKQSFERVTELIDTRTRT